MMLKKKDVVPTLTFPIKLETYGMQINGEVPKFALIDREAPREIIKSEIKYMMYLLISRILKFIISNMIMTVFKI